MSNTPVSTNFLQSLQIFSKFIIECVCEKLRVLSIYNISLSIEEPFWDFVLSGVLKDCDDTFEFFSGKFSGTTRKTLQLLSENRLLRSTSACNQQRSKRNERYFLDDHVRVSSTDTLDFSQREHDFVFSVDVGVEETEDVLECILVGDDESHGGLTSIECEG